MEFKSWFVANRRHFSRFICYWITFFLVMLAHWFDVNFGAVNLPQLWYYLHFSSGIITAADSTYLVTFSLECLLAPSLMATLMIAVESWIETSMATQLRDRSRLIRAAFFSSSMQMLGRMLPLCVLILSTGLLLSSLSTFTYIKSMFSLDQFSRSYVESATVKLTAKKPKNLVLIYVESLEASYSDKIFFGQDLLADINAAPGSSFKSYLSAPATGWTVAGMVATQCGVPLQVVVGESWQANGERNNSFLQNATCLGDILKKYGFRNVFLGGANLGFAAKGRFLRDHGYDDLYGASEWRKLGMTQPFSAWGMHDDDLLNVAKTKLLELKDAGKPFNLTILTVDTHQPDGFYSKTCIARGATRFEDILKCTSWELADFVEFAVAHDLLKTTNFVIIGDHLARGNAMNDQLQSDPQRRIFNKFIAADMPTRNRDVISPFDLFPSILEFIGIDVDGNRMALGCSAFFETSPHCVRQTFSNDLLGELAVSPAYRKLWVK